MAKKAVSYLIIDYELWLGVTGRVKLNNRARPQSADTRITAAGKRDC